MKAVLIVWGVLALVWLGFTIHDKLTEAQTPDQPQAQYVAVDYQKYCYGTLSQLGNIPSEAEIQQCIADVRAAVARHDAAYSR